MKVASISQDIEDYIEKYCEVKAAGIIFHRTKGATVEFLMRQDLYWEDIISKEGEVEIVMEDAVKSTGKGYADFGGKIEAGESYFLAAARECQEESNGVFKLEDCLERLKTAQRVYVPTCKNIIFLVKLDEDVNMKQFGDYEQRSKTARLRHQVDWNSSQGSFHIRVPDFEQLATIVESRCNFAEVLGKNNFPHSIKMLRSKWRQLDQDSFCYRFLEVFQRCAFALSQ